jgi:hypothetical protein
VTVTSGVSTFKLGVIINSGTSASFNLGVTVNSGTSTLIFGVTVCVVVSGRVGAFTTGFTAVVADNLSFNLTDSVKLLL